MTTVYATAHQLLITLKKQDITLTPEQVSSCSITDEYGQAYKIRQGIVDEVIDIADSLFSPVNAACVREELGRLKLRGRGRPVSTPDGLLKENYRCYKLNSTNRISVPAGSFFSLSPGDKVTTYFVKEDGELLIRITPHK